MLSTYMFFFFYFFSTIGASVRSRDMVWKVRRWALLNVFLLTISL